MTDNDYALKNLKFTFDCLSNCVSLGSYIADISMHSEKNVEEVKEPTSTKDAELKLKLLMLADECATYGTSIDRVISDVGSQINEKHMYNCVIELKLMEMCGYGISNTYVANYPELKEQILNLTGDGE